MHIQSFVFDLPFTIISDIYILDIGNDSSTNKDGIELFGCISRIVY